MQTILSSCESNLTQLYLFIIYLLISKGSPRSPQFRFPLTSCSHRFSSLSYCRIFLWPHRLSCHSLPFYMLSFSYLPWWLRVRPHLWPLSLFKLSVSLTSCLEAGPGFYYRRDNTIRSRGRFRKEYLPYYYYYYYYYLHWSHVPRCRGPWIEMFVCVEAYR